MKKFLLRRNFTALIASIILILVASRGLAQQVALTSFTPAISSSGSTVTLTGRNFSNVTEVRFGGVAALFKLVNATTITAVPKAGSSGIITLSTTANVTVSSSSSFMLQCTITSFTPAVAASGTTVTIYGTDLTYTTAVSFGGVPATYFHIIDGNSLTAVVGKGAPGAVSVTTSNAGTATSLTSTKPQSTITSFSPLFAPGGSTVTLTGTNFTGATAVSFGGVAAASFRVVSATTITAIPAAGSSGIISVTTSGNGTAISSASFLVQCTISSISPQVAASGSTITITGTDFTNATAVSFGGIAAYYFHIVNGTTITAIPKPGSSGVILVTTSTNGTSTSSPGFMLQSTISSFNPLASASGATVTLTGTYFTNATSVTFGGIAAASFKVINSTTITAVVGAGTSGLISVLTSSNGTATSASPIVLQSTISSFTPLFGASGSTVTITGTDFTNATGVSFGGIAAASFMVVNPTTITAIAKTGTSGVIAVMTSTNGKATSSASYMLQSTLTSFTPLAAAAGATVTITGTSFTGATAVSFGGTAAASFQVVNATTITAVVGAGATGVISVTTPNNGTAVSKAAFTFSAFTPYAYIANLSDNTVSVINLLTNQVSSTVPVGAHPFAVEITPDGKTVYIMNVADNSISVLDGVSNSVSRVIHAGNGPIAAVIHPNGLLLYVANQTDNTVSVVNTATNTVTAIIPVGLNPGAISITQDGSKVYTANNASNTVSVISTQTNKVISTINVGLKPFAICISPDGKFVYETNDGSNSVSIISTATNLVTDSIIVGQYPACLKLSQDGKTLYVTAGILEVIDLASRNISSITVGYGPEGLNLSADGKTLYVVNIISNSVSVVNLATSQVTSTVMVGNTPLTNGNFIASQAGRFAIPVPLMAFEKTPALISSTSLFLLYPNPGRGLVSVGFNATAAGKAIIMIFDINGRKVAQQTVSSREANARMLTGLDLSKNSAGIYMIEVLGADGKLIGQTKYVKAL